MRTFLVGLLLLCFFSSAVAQRRNLPLQGMVRLLDSLSKVNDNDVPKIYDVTFANVDPIGTIINDFGAKLYERDLQYLVPRIMYDAKSDCQMNLSMKLSDSDGDSVSEDLQVSFKKGSKRYTDDLGPVCGGLDAGDYIYELWLENIKVYSGRLNVASGGPIVEDCGIFKVRDIKFYNLSDEKPISEYGAKLYAADVRYLASAIYYYDLMNKKALMNTKYYIRIYTPKGVLMKCRDVSAVGYTTYSTVKDSDIDSEYFVLNGVGQERQHLQPGSYRYEVWMDNCKIVDTNVTLF